MCLWQIIRPDAPAFRVVLRTLGFQDVQPYWDFQPRPQTNSYPSVSQVEASAGSTQENSGIFKDTETIIARFPAPVGQ
jgi:hypothetical protein